MDVAAELKELRRVNKDYVRLKPVGKYGMATIEVSEGVDVARSVVSSLVEEAVRLNATLGNPAAIASRY